MMMDEDDKEKNEEEALGQRKIGSDMMNIMGTNKRQKMLEDEEKEGEEEIIMADADVKREHLYWFQEDWLHRFYMSGIEETVKEMEKNNPPFRNIGGDDSIEKFKLFYWEPIWEQKGMELNQLGIPKFEHLGWKLFARESESGENFNPVVNALKDESSKDDGRFRLYACRNFEAGDAIMFVTEYEEGTQKLILGGGHVRISEDQGESNVYLASNRALRCTKSIQRSEEIVRWKYQQESEFLEKIDRVVVCLDTMKVGRIGKMVTPVPNQSVVYYKDGTHDTVPKKGEGHVYVYRPGQTTRKLVIVSIDG